MGARSLEEVRQDVLDIESCIIALDDKLHKMLEINNRLRIRLNDIRRELHEEETNGRDNNNSTDTE